MPTLREAIRNMSTIKHRLDQWNMVAEDFLPLIEDMSQIKVIGNPVDGSPLVFLHDWNIGCTLNQTQRDNLYRVIEDTLESYEK